jgi:hypothetical protein
MIESAEVDEHLLVVRAPVRVFWMRLQVGGSLIGGRSNLRWCGRLGLGETGWFLSQQTDRREERNERRGG